MNFYLNVVDENIKTEEDHPSIGIILCKSKNKIIAEYSLRDITKPVCIAEYTVTRAIPESLKLNLPTAEELEKNSGIKLI